MINPETFTAKPEQTSASFIDGTVEVTIGRETRRVPALKTSRGITAYRIGVRYRTGAKVWSGRVERFADTGKEQVTGGFDNRVTNSKIAYVTGFFEDVAEQHRSKR